MSFWILAALLTAATVTVLLWPLLRPRADGNDRAVLDRAVYRDQLAELDRDVARGLISPDQAAAARAEIGRRLLRTETEGERATMGSGRGTRVLALVLAAAVPLLALAIYLPTGSPDLQARPAAGREDAATNDAGEIDRLIARLRDHLAANPDEAPGWLLLGRSEAGRGRFADAESALRRALELAPDDPVMAAALAETLVLAREGVVSAEARRLFEQVLRANPADPRARFYVGEAQAQSGEARAALDTWAGLMRDTAPDAPFLPLLRDRMAAVALEAGLDPAEAVPEPGTASSIASLPPEQRQAAIRSMVDGLAARLETAPDDLAGWERLGQARLVLGDNQAAADAFARAAALAPDRIDLRLAQADALMAGLPDDAPLPPGAVAALESALVIDPKRPEPLWHLGRDAAASGDVARAVELLTRLRDLLPAGSEDRRMVERELDALLGAGAAP